VFKYVSEGHELPPADQRDPNALYFVADDKQIFRGAMLMADHIDIDEYLESYKVKNIEIVGEGDYIQSIAFDELQGIISVTKSDLQTVVRRIIAEDPTIAKITDTPHWNII
jgi:Tfp pilus assembly protein PilP